MLLDVYRLIQRYHLYILKQDYLVGGDTIVDLFDSIKCTCRLETQYDNLHLITVNSKVLV